MANDAFLAGFEARKAAQGKGKKPPAGGVGLGAASSEQSGIGKAISTARDALKKFRKGGPVRKTGLALVHRGEYVIPAKQVRKIASSGKRHSIIKS